jgi:hypothetical protein
MFFRVDMPNSNPPLFMVFDSDPVRAVLEANPLDCGMTHPMNLPGAHTVGTQHTICNDSGNNITVTIIKI